MSHDALPRSPVPLEARRLETIFSSCFAERYQTRLEGGGEEPLYIVSRAPDNTPHRIVYREDYFASALHEVAHWCLAGAERRQQDDYGYWYRPDGRSPEEQLEFERVESRPQALEWIFSDACGHPFYLSADNLEGGSEPSERFSRAVDEARHALLEKGLPERAARFAAALREAFGTPG